MRLHYFDNGRAIASMVGFFYHVGLIFSIPWIINTNPNNFNSSLHVFTEFISLFRMPLFIFIAGYFAIYSVKKYNFGDFAKNKLLRLGVPLLSSLYILVFLQHLFADMLFKKTSSLLDVFNTVNPLSSSFTLSHLWFLYVVIIYNFLLYFILKRTKKYSNFYKKIKEKLMSSNILTVDALFLFLSLSSSLFFIIIYVFSPVNHGLLPDHRFGINLPYFVMGVITFVFWDKFSKAFITLSMKRVIISLIVMISSFTIMMYLKVIIGNSIIALALSFFFETIAKYYSLLLVLYILYTLFNKTNKVLKYLADSSYSIFLLHQPVIVVVSYFFLKYIGSSTLISYICILIISICVSYVIDYLVIRKTKIGKFLFTGVKSKPIPQSTKVEERLAT